MALFDRFKKNEEMQEMKKKVKDEMKESAKNFDKLFSLKNENK